MTLKCHHVRLWHKADISLRRSGVCFRWQSGHAADLPATPACDPKMQTGIAIHDPRGLKVALADLIEDRFVRKFDESGELDALYAAHGIA